jgi:hypothetical protein
MKWSSISPGTRITFELVAAGRAEAALAEGAPGSEAVSPALAPTLGWTDFGGVTGATGLV